MYWLPASAGWGQSYPPVISLGWAVKWIRLRDAEVSLCVCELLVWNKTTCAACQECRFTFTCGDGDACWPSHAHHSITLQVTGFKPQRLVFHRREPAGQVRTDSTGRTPPPPKKSSPLKYVSFSVCRSLCRHFARQHAVDCWNPIIRMLPRKMVSVVTTVTGRSDVGSQIFHLQSLPALSV